MVYNPDVRCESCKGIVKNNADLWECLSCQTKNDNSKTSCKYYKKTKTVKEESKILGKTESKKILEDPYKRPNCSKCNQIMHFLFCSYCKKKIHYNEKCLDCKKFISDITICYACKIKSPPNKESR